MSDEFYIGYVLKAPAALGKRTVRVAAVAVMAGLAAGALLIFDQAPFAPSRFEYGQYRDYSGVIEEWPYPMLRTSREMFLLVAPGKHGLAAQTKGLQGRTVRLQGALVERGQDRMLEVLPASLSVTSGAPAPPPAMAALGRVTLWGEIVDSKCFLGVMNPGNGKVHRDCAVRCISGGAPSAFVARDASGAEQVLLLVGSDGRALNREVLSFVAEPLVVTGDLVRSGSSLILKAEPSHFRRESGINSATW